MDRIKTVERISVAARRADASGPMEVVSGAVVCEAVHFTAPPARTLADQAAAFSSSAERCRFKLAENLAK